MKEMKVTKLRIHMHSIQVIKLRVQKTNEGDESKETNHAFKLNPRYDARLITIHGNQ
jgi:hypothetical protein